MIFDKPLHLPGQKRKPLTTVISLPSDSLMRFAMFIGHSFPQSHLYLTQDEEMVTATAIPVAKKILKERLNNNVTPTFIICNMEGGESLLPGLLELLQDHKHYRKIPFFVYAESLDTVQKETLSKLGGIDDIITAKTTPEEFSTKLQFARKFRLLSAKTQMEEKQQKRMLTKQKVDYVLKRGFDITASGLILLALSPVFLVIAAAIKIDSRGPIFYISKRAGNRYKVFNFYKFRTMVADADKRVKDLSHLNQYDVNNANGGPVFFKLSNDPRVTKLGAFLRNSSIDELPQLLNVLLGDMSLVGNRPLPLYEAASLTTDNYAGRFLAPAGITGLWQIKKRGQKEMSVDERINLDKDYAEKTSFLYDMWILTNTPKALIQKDNV
ncbi:lipopolysaccharide/colanic/teichoic acid biosynthesis glycosyltransferase [Chitinophaga skermanii]|uniref:Lipopolysaccharide/colanic/teichoic acid biosynthesis glycosyltransferase n=1 Tax=Chitinophaga skermanii TaxID=331697 RepID=A0A327QZ49_9BACT|nr:sugar transferase [Chitinophaga skermanii]RAJ06947.1 lipopolysaccharide/colanic/teichoic acid biosynthesis glycosyltransferase [Chitinophaga skermanii]